MRFGSVCSGIEAASVAWGALGWEAAWFSEIDKWPSRLLARHYPHVANLGDMTLLPAFIRGGIVGAPDVLCGGTPCQAFSVAGSRKSLDDARGNLSLTFCEIANAIDEQRAARGEQPSIIFWENVPGVLNTRDNAFGCFLAGLAGESLPLEPSGGKWTNAGVVLGPARAVAWRVLDAQYFGVAQRRRRVFVVASARDGFCPARALFEYEGERRDTPPRRDTGQETAALAGAGASFPASSFGQYVDGVGTLRANGGGSETLVAQCLTTGTGQRYDPETETRIPCFGIPGNWVGRAPENGGNAVEPMRDLAPCLTKTDRHAVAYSLDSQLNWSDFDGVAGPLIKGSPSGGGSPLPAVVYEMHGLTVRRLTPTECERLQGFPDGYTRIDGDKTAHGPRYKALGNSWAVPNVRWIGERIAAHLRGDL